MKKLTFAALLLGQLVSGATFAAKPKAAPVDATFENTCATDVALKLGSSDVKVGAGQTSLLTVTPAKPGEAFVLTAAQADGSNAEWAILTFNRGGQWKVKLSGCAAGKADVLATQVTDPNSGSPQAAAQVHFRARTRGHIEYQAGGMGGFKPLSVAMTSYMDAKPGELVVNLRKRGAAAGPVVGNVKRTVTILPGRKQVVEVEYSGAEPFLSFEDEGPLK